MKKGFIYWLFSSAKKPLYVNDFGIIQEGNPITFLTSNPTIYGLTWSFNGVVTLPGPVAGSSYTFNYLLPNGVDGVIINYRVQGTSPWLELHMQTGTIAIVSLIGTGTFDVTFRGYFQNHFISASPIVQVSGTSLTPVIPEDFGKPAHLKYSPDGWKDILVKYGRNIKYWGLFREFTATMKFKLDGAKILRYLMWNYGIEAICHMGISKLNKTVFPDKYEAWYSGELDFSKFNQSKTDVSISVMEGGLSKYLKAFENTTYEIPVDADLEAIQVLFDGFPFTNSVKYIFIRQVFPVAGFVSRRWYIPIAMIVHDGSTQGILNQDQELIAYENPPNDKWFIKSEDKNVDLNITGTINVTLIANPENRSTIIYIEKSNAGIVTDNYILHDQIHSSIEDFTIDVSIIIPLVPGDSLALIDDLGAAETVPLYFHSISDTGNFNISYDVTFDPSVSKAIYPLRLFQKLTDKMTGGRYTAKSTFLSGLTDYCVTSGQAIRNHEGDATATVHGSVIKTSITDFFKSFNHFQIGLGIENDGLIIEKLEYFFRKNISVTLGEAEATFTPADDISFNTIKAGYTNQTYDAINGKDEPNVTQGYTTSITRIVRELDLISPYRTDMYGIELSRLNLSGKDTTDNSADNDTFMINIEKKRTERYFRLNRPAFDSITGLLHPEGAFNILLSPKRKVLNNGAFIHSVLDKQDINSIVFQTGEKNSLLSTTLGGEVIAENGNIQIASLPDKLFLPYYISLKTKVPIRLKEIMDADPYSKVSFIYQGTTYTGYLMDGGLQPSSMETQSWKLLAAPDNNLLKLIDTI